MKELIIKALGEAFVKMENAVPQTKKQEQRVCITDVKPIDLSQFMKDNNIPENAEFGSGNVEEDEYGNGYDYFDDHLLTWDISIPTTEEEKLTFKRKRFDDYAWNGVYSLLIKNGYKRIGCSSGEFAAYNDTTIYDMYINNEFDRLKKYYSLRFVKIIE